MKRFLIVVILIAFLAGCSGAADPSPAPPNDPAPSTLRIAAGRSFWQGSATNIYLHSSTNVWEPLVLFDDHMEPRMKLASAITPSADGLTWTITLREGIAFHDGSAFTAEVAAFNLERLYRYNPVTRAFDPEFARSGEFGDISEISVIFDYAFTVTHREPIPDFPARLSLENSAMFALASFDEDRVITHPYGTGPFLYEAYDAQNSILTLRQNRAYHRGVPAIDTVYFFNIPDAAMRLAALQSGEIDVIADVGGVLPQQAAEILAASELVLRERQVSTVHYLGINSNEGSLFHDTRLRNALGLSLDRDAIVEVLLHGYGRPAISVVSDLSTGWVIDADYRFDPAAAQALVTEAVGEERPPAVILINSALTGRWPYRDIAVLLQAQLVAIGIDATIETVDGATWTERMRNGDYDITLHPFTVSSGEPIYFFIRNIASTGANNLLRGYGINSPELDALIARAAVEVDLSARRAYYAELQRLVRAADYIIPIWYDVTLYAMHERVRNFQLDVLFRPDLFAVELWT